MPESHDLASPPMEAHKEVEAKPVSVEKGPRDVKEEQPITQEDEPTIDEAATEDETQPFEEGPEVEPVPVISS